MESDKFLDSRCKAPQEKQRRKISENIKKDWWKYNMWPKEASSKGIWYCWNSTIDIQLLLLEAVHGWACLTNSGFMEQDGKYMGLSWSNKPRTTLGKKMLWHVIPCSNSLRLQYTDLAWHCRYMLFYSYPYFLKIYMGINDAVRKLWIYCWQFHLKFLLKMEEIT